jgi:hypothetical protein
MRMRRRKKTELDFRVGEVESEKFEELTEVVEMMRLNEVLMFTGSKHSKHWYECKPRCPFLLPPATTSNINHRSTTFSASILSLAKALNYFLLALMLIAVFFLFRFLPRSSLECEQATTMLPP